jgi:hypothetical protein
MISLQGNVDWYRFWLQGARRLEPVLSGETTATLKEQYARWDQMADMKAAAKPRPACVRES